MGKGIKIRRIGGSFGLTLSRSLLEKLGVGEGDVLYPVMTANGLELTPFDPDFEEALAASSDFMRRYPSAMKKLAE